jgi:hypothetical protein
MPEDRVGFENKPQGALVGLWGGLGGGFSFGGVVHTSVGGVNFGDGNSDTI